MPWTSADAGRHNKRAAKGSQAKKWAAIANAVRASYRKRGFPTKKADVVAIRTANSRLHDHVLTRTPLLTE